MLVLRIRNRRYQKRVERSSKLIESLGPKVNLLYHYAFFFVADHVLGQYGGNGRSGPWGARGPFVFISILLSKPSAVSSKHSQSLDIPFHVLTLTRTHFRIQLAVRVTNTCSFWKPRSITACPWLFADASSAGLNSTVRCIMGAGGFPMFRNTVNSKSRNVIM